MNSKQRDLTYVYVNGNFYGYFDGEYIYDGYPNMGNMIWRIDEDDVYTIQAPAKYIAYMQGNKAIKNSDGNELFMLCEFLQRSQC